MLYQECRQPGPDSYKHLNKLPVISCFTAPGRRFT